ncbi:MAG TPA: acetyl-CoA carboxylase biotin carboxyl carrier protein subunit [Bryobacteraceae bacterium]|nr:acetyl-CoA carboxylase biotin carboxyl carrier protein subunit [Bryobacteraceae bacterium]
MKLRIEVEKKSYEVSVEFVDDDHSFPHDVKPGEINVPESVTRPRPHLKLLEDTFCRSPIAGRVVAVLAVPGQALRKNEPVLVIEAMKMEIQIGPVVDGVLKTIRVSPGEAVGTGQLLFELA